MPYIEDQGSCRPIYIDPWTLPWRQICFLVVVILDIECCCGRWPHYCNTTGFSGSACWGGGEHETFGNPCSCSRSIICTLVWVAAQLGKALQSDLYWATEAPYTHLDFLHEVFQCHILNFIFDNHNAEFMKSHKADASQKANPIPTFLSSWTSQIDSSCGCSSSSKCSLDPESEPVSCHAFLIHYSWYSCLETIKEIENFLAIGDV